MDFVFVEKISKVKQAEAKAETLYLHGFGVANQRRAIAEGMKNAVGEWKEKEHPKGGYTSKDILNLLLLTQYLDTLVAVGSNSMIVRPSPTEVFAMKQNIMTTTDNSVRIAPSSTAAAGPPDLLWS